MLRGRFIAIALFAVLATVLLPAGLWHDCGHGTEQHSETDENTANVSEKCLLCDFHLGPFQGKILQNSLAVEGVKATTPILKLIKVQTAEILNTASRAPPQT